MILSDELIQTFTDQLTAFGKSADTVRAYRTDLRDFQRFLAGREVTELEAAQWITAGRQTWAPNTTNRRIASTKKFAKEMLGARDFLRDYTGPRPVVGASHPLPTMTAGVVKMIDVAESVQRAALVALCGLCGLRVGEAVNIRPEHINAELREITVRGKGDKTRPLPISAKAWEAIEPAYNEAMEHLGATIVGVGNRQARAIIKRTAILAGMDESVASHDLRHTFGTSVCETHGVRTAQEMLGHASVTTTERYTHVSAASKRAAVEAMA